MQNIHWLVHLEPSVYGAMVAALLYLGHLRVLRGENRWVAASVLLFCAVELTGSALGFQNIPNLWFYNLMLIPQVVLVSFTLNLKMSSQRLKRVYNTGIAFLTIMHAVNLSLVQGLHQFANFTYIPASIWIAGGAFFFLRDQLENNFERPFNSLINWFALALLIDHAGCAPILSLLGWKDFISTAYATQLWLVVGWIFACFFFINSAGLLYIRYQQRKA